ncbi:MAG: family 1 glycosylhydrolase [Sphingomonas sp.]
MVGADGAAVTLGALRAHLDQFVASGAISRYALPDRLFRVDALPRTSVGKIDKKALRALVEPATEPAPMTPSVSRRTLLGAAPRGRWRPALPARAVPSQPFLWGAATAGHQVEGNNVSSDLWLLEQLKPSPFKEPSGDACDSLHRWREDIAIVRALGLNCYRFSVEWSRIEPAEGQFSQAFLDHYGAMVDHCRAQGIAPVVTLSHFTAPRWFAAKGGGSIPMRRGFSRASPSGWRAGWPRASAIW